MENKINLKSRQVTQHIVAQASNYIRELNPNEKTFVWVGEDTDFKQITIDWLFLYTLGIADEPA